MAVELNTLQINVDWKDSEQGAKRVSEQAVKTGKDMSEMGDKAEAAGKKAGAAFKKMAEDAKSGTSAFLDEARKNFSEIKSASEGSATNLLVFAGKAGIWGAAAALAFKAVSFGIDALKDSATAAGGPVAEFDRLMESTKQRFNEGFSRSFSRDVDEATGSTRSFNQSAKELVDTLRFLPDLANQAGQNIGNFARGAAAAVRDVGGLVSMMRILGNNTGPSAIGVGTSTNFAGFVAGAAANAAGRGLGALVGGPGVPGSPWWGSAISGDGKDWFGAESMKEKDKKSAGGSGGGKPFYLDADLVARYSAELGILQAALDAGSISSTEFTRRQEKLQERLGNSLEAPLRANVLAPWRAAWEENERVLRDFRMRSEANLLGLGESITYGFRRWSRDFGSFSKQIGEAIPGVINQLGDGFGDAFTSFITGAKSAQEAFGAFASSFLSDIARMIAQKTILAGINGFIGPSGFSGISSIFGGGPSVLGGDWSGLGAKGALDIPTLKGGLDSPGMGSKGTVVGGVVVNVYGGGNGGTEVDSPDNPELGYKLGQAIRAVVSQVLDDEQRQGGRLARDF